jgi:hypothetical protein
MGGGGGARNARTERKKGNRKRHWKGSEFERKSEVNWEGSGGIR